MVASLLQDRPELARACAPAEGLAGATETQIGVSLIHTAELGFIFTGGAPVATIFAGIVIRGSSWPPLGVFDFAPNSGGWGTHVTLYGVGS